MSRVSIISQAFPPAPAFTEKNIQDLSNKVYLVTGANTGIGKAVAEILYSKNATVWLACRNEEKAQEAMRSIREKAPSSTGKLKFLKLDLSDLNTIKQTVDTFLAQESRLDVLFNNAGVMGPPKGAKSAQGYELQLGVNNLGPHLFTKLVTPLLVKTAKQAPKDSVRVVWVSSLLAESTSPKHGIDFENLDYKKNDSFWMEITAKKYGISKAGNYYQSTEFARRHRADGVISVALHPGSIDSELDRNFTNPVKQKLISYFKYPPVNGAYTELYAALSSDITMDKTGSWIVPWGRPSYIRRDLYLGSKPASEGGTGTAERFWEWCDAQTKSHL